MRQIAAMVPDMETAVGPLLELVRALDRRLDMMTADRADYWHGTREIAPANVKLLTAPQSAAP